MPWAILIGTGAIRLRVQVDEIANGKRLFDGAAVNQSLRTEHKDRIYVATNQETPCIAGQKEN